MLVPIVLVSELRRPRSVGGEAEPLSSHLSCRVLRVADRVLPVHLMDEVLALLHLWYDCVERGSCQHFFYH